MKTVKILLIVLAITLTNVVSANNPIKEKPITKEESSLIAKEISSMLVKPNFEVKKELQAKVTFISNKNNEIVVLKVDTDNELLENFIKTRLNYHVMSMKLTSNKTYQLPVKVIID